jgi:predicted nucleic acid-binding protein
MAERVFLDTNVIVYADDESAGPKCKRAGQLVVDLATSGQAVLSTQVIQEYFAVATRKLGLPADRARQRIEELAQLDVVQINAELILSAIDIHRLHKVSFWDALVIRSAAVGGCTRLLSEDLHTGRTFDGVRIENPFAVN